jgi:hypothetical protein
MTLQLGHDFNVVTFLDLHDVYRDYNICICAEREREKMSARIR